MLHEILVFRKLTGGKHWIVGTSPPIQVWVAEHVFDTSHSDGVLDYNFLIKHVIA